MAPAGFKLTAQHGHLEIGYTLAGWVIILAFLGMGYWSDGEPLDLWLTWPWWGKTLSVIAPILILVLGGLFEKSRAWPKS